MKKIKKGISLIVLVITIIVMAILVGTVVTVGVSSFESVDANKFALEILNIQNSVDTYYYKNGSYPVADEIVFDLTGLSAESLEQFNAETITENKVALKKINLSLIGITETEFGNNKEQLDIYALSEITGKVYYLAGIEYEDVINYTLTSNLYRLVDSNTVTDNNVVSSEEIKVYDVIFKPSNVNYTNVPVTVEVNLPKEAVINWTTVSNEKSVSEVVTQDKYKVINVNTTSTDKTGNYSVEINYTYNGTTKTAKYDVTNFDNVVPTLIVTEQREGQVRRINITATDETSNIKVVKYAETEITNQDFFKSSGKIVKNSQLVLDSDIHYTLYVEDKAGNYYILNPIVYAIYSETDNSFTFLRSGQNISVGDTYNGKKVTALYTDFLDDGEYDSETQVPWYDYRTNITSVMVEDLIQPNGIAYWFYNFNNCSTLDVTKIDTSKVTSTKYTFGSCGTTVDTFKIIGLNDWDVSKVMNMGWMFNNIGTNATDFDIGDLSNWNTESAISFYSMFASAGKKAEIFDIGNIGNWKTSNVGYFRSMFMNTGSIAERWYIGDISSWDTSKVGDMAQMFLGAAANAKEFNVGNIGKWNTVKATDMYEMFYHAGENSEVWYVGDLSNWDTSKVTRFNAMFAYAGSATKNWSIGDISKWNISSSNGELNEMFSHAGENSTEFNIGDLSTKQITKSDGTTYIAWDVSKIVSMFAMFGYAGQNSEEFYIGEIDNWQTGNVTLMTNMFCGAGVNADWSLDCSQWDVSSVTSYVSFNYLVTTKVIAPNFEPQS